MAPLPATRFADKVQAWSPSLADMTNSIHDSIPRCSEEVRQKLRHWNQSLSRHYPWAFKKTGEIPSDLTSAEKLRAAEHERTRLDSDLNAARKAVAENAKVTKKMRGLREPKGIDLKLAANDIKSRVRYPATVSRHTSPAFSPTTGCKTVVSTHARGALQSPTQSASSTGLNKGVQSSAVSEQHTDRRYSFRSQKCSQHSPPDIDSRLHRSASASNLAHQVRGSLKRLKRSATNANLPNKLLRSKPDDTDTLEAPVNTLRHSAPPGGLPKILRCRASLDCSRADHQADSQEPLLDSIAENGEYQYQRPPGETFRQDLIFALHDSRSCSPREPPVFVDTIPLGNIDSFTQRRESVTGSESLSRSTQDPQRNSSYRHPRPFSTTSKLEDQIHRTSDIAGLRDLVNDSRARRGIPPLKFHQSLCADAGIVATMYDVLNGANGSSWGTRIQLQEGGTTLELVGPPGVGGRVTGKMWADGEHSRQTQRGRGRSAEHHQMA